MSEETKTPAEETKVAVQPVDFASLKIEPPKPKTSMLEEVKTSQEKTETPKEKSVFFGGKKFTSIDELANYTASLEKEKKILETKPQTSSQKTTEMTEEDEFLKFATDSKKYKADLKEEVKAEIRQEYTREQAERKIWSKFYEEFPDLKGHEDLVELSQGRLWQQVKDLPVTEGLTEIAKATRQRIAGIRGKSFEGTKELTSGQAMAMPSGSATGSQVAVKVGKTDFASQLRAFQKRQRG